MLKPVITATALVVLAGASIAYAQDGFGDVDYGFGDHGPRVVEYWHHLSTADISAFADARIAALKAGLQLTPDQEKNWPPFEQALRDMVQLRIQRVQARQAAGDQQQGTPFDRLSQVADNMAKASAALKKIAGAGAPLYQNLNDDQKNRFLMLAHILRPHHGMGGGMDGEHERGRRGEHEHGWGGEHEHD
jgi:zinc resistance-associated protein